MAKKLLGKVRMKQNHVLLGVLTAFIVLGSQFSAASTTCEALFRPEFATLIETSGNQFIAPLVLALRPNAFDPNIDYGSVFEVPSRPAGRVEVLGSNGVGALNFNPLAYFGGLRISRNAHGEAYSQKQNFSISFHDGRPSMVSSGATWYSLRFELANPLATQFLADGTMSYEYAATERSAMPAALSTVDRIKFYIRDGKLRYIDLRVHSIGLIAETWHRVSFDRWQP